MQASEQWKSKVHPGSSHLPSGGFLSVAGVFLMRKQLVDGMAFSFSICSQPASSQGGRDTICQMAWSQPVNLTMSDPPTADQSLCHGSEATEERKDAAQIQANEVRGHTAQHSLGWVGLHLSSRWPSACH